MTVPNAVVVLQSGGPSSTVNASLAGVVEEAERAALRVIVARAGLVGLAEGNVRELARAELDLDALADAPGCALVSSRRTFTLEHQRAAVAFLEDQDAGLVVVGGDGSMRGSSALVDAGVPVVGVVNTCDNDLADFAYTPGFPTCASRLGQWAVEALADCRSLGGFDDVAVLETMGRDAGWLAAASGALARADVIVVPERPRNLAGLIRDITQCVADAGDALVVVAEGAVECDGRLLAERAGAVPTDNLGRPVVSLGPGPAMALARALREEAGLQARVARPGVLQRSGPPLSGDRDIARELGREAVRHVRQGESAWALGPGAKVPCADLAPQPMPETLLDVQGVDQAAVLQAVGELLEAPRVPAELEGAAHEVSR
jgi:6-phosphofructokinase 1